MSESLSRAEMKRAYKETPKQAGIFHVKNLTSGDILLGSSTNLHGPLGKHRFLLTIGKHDNQALQRDWNRLGADAFAFEILEDAHRRKSRRRCDKGAFLERAVAHDECGRDAFFLVEVGFDDGSGSSCRLVIGEFFHVGEEVDHFEEIRDPRSVHGRDLGYRHIASVAFHIYLVFCERLLCALHVCARLVYLVYGYDVGELCRFDAV